MSAQPASPAPGRAWLGPLCSLAATAIWSGNFIVARGLAETVAPATLSFLRWGVAFLGLLPLAGPALWRQRAALRGHWGHLALTALIGVSVFNALLYLAARTTQALNLALLATTSPVFMILFARILHGEPVTRQRLAGLAATLAGVVLLITRGDLSRLAGLTLAAGDAWMLLASALFAAYSLLLRHKPRDLGPSPYLLALIGLGLAMLAPWAGVEAVLYGLPALDWRLAGSVLYIGLGASLAAYSLWNQAVARCGAAKAGLIYYTLPLFSGAEAWLILGEPIGWSHAVSAGLILGGIGYAARR